MLPEPIEVTLLVVDALEQIDALYLIGGSLASTLHGVARNTLDTDIVADLDLSQAQPLAELLQDAFYFDLETMRRAIARRTTFNLIHLRTMFKVDIFVARDDPFVKQQLERRQAWPVASGSNRRLYVATAEDMVLAKLQWYRQGNEVSDQQWRDVLGLLNVQRGRLDLSYLRDWAAILQVNDLLERAMQDIDLP